DGRAMVVELGAAKEGAVLLMAPPDASATYPELVRARRCRLVEVGGRLGAEAATWLRMLAGQRTLETQAAARAPWVARWSGLLAVAAQRAIAESLLELRLAGECDVAGEAPELHEVLADVRWQLPVIGSRQGRARVVRHILMGRFLRAKHGGGDGKGAGDRRVDTTGAGVRARASSLVIDECSPRAGHVATQLANADVPESVLGAFALAKLTSGRRKHPKRKAKIRKGWTLPVGPICLEPLSAGMSASLPPEPPRPGSSPLDDEDDDVPYVPRRGRWRRRVKPFGCRRVKDERDPAAHAWGPELEEVLSAAQMNEDFMLAQSGATALLALASLDQEAVDGRVPPGAPPGNGAEEEEEEEEEVGGGPVYRYKCTYGARSGSRGQGHVLNGLRESTD
ncbi:unnamed protein product, partial [Symbiodinium necroappetens]